MLFRSPAIEAAQELIDRTPEELLLVPSPPMADFLEGYLSMKQHVLVRFGKWQEIVDQDMPENQELYAATSAMMRYAKSVAHSAMGNVEEAEKEKALFLEAKTKVPESRRVHNNRVYDLLDIAEQMLEGELEYRRGNYDAAFAHLRKSVELDDPTKTTIATRHHQAQCVPEASGPLTQHSNLGQNLDQRFFHLGPKAFPIIQCR